jgi:hypothetical protein
MDSMDEEVLSVTNEELVEPGADELHAAGESVTSTAGPGRYLVVAVLIVAAFFGSYSYAASRGVASNAVAIADCASGQCDQAAGSCDGSSGACGASGAVSGDVAVAPAWQPGACCGSAAPEEPIEGSAVIDGEVQRISVDVSQGFFNPNVVRLQSDMPAEIVFGEGFGCMAEVMFKDFGVFENLTDGGVVVELPALSPGEYTFSCGMEMVFGQLIVE